MNQMAVKVERLTEPRRDPATQALLEGFVTDRALTPSPIWYWLDYNADHGAPPERIIWFLRDADIHELLKQRRPTRS